MSKSTSPQNVIRKLKTNENGLCLDVWLALLSVNGVERVDNKELEMVELMERGMWTNTASLEFLSINIPSGSRRRPGAGQPPFLPSRHLSIASTTETTVVRDL